VKDHLSHRHGDEPIVLRVSVSFNRSGGVDVTQDDATKDGPLRVCVTWQKRDANGRISL
jgi:hypothetical protein